MRKIEACLGSFLWVAVATLMPMAALEPVQAGQAEPPALASASCEEGSAHCDAAAL